MVYAFFDGDDVGPTIERLLVENRIEEARAFSESVTAALRTIETMLLSSPGVKIVFLGGDDILIQMNPEQQGRAFLENLREAFHRATGNTMSCGVAGEIGEVIQNLYLAKLFGKNAIRGWDAK